MTETNFIKDGPMLPISADRDMLDAYTREDLSLEELTGTFLIDAPIRVGNFWVFAFTFHQEIPFHKMLLFSRFALSKVLPKGREDQVPSLGFYESVPCNRIAVDLRYVYQDTITEEWIPVCVLTWSEGLSGMNIDPSDLIPSEVEVARTIKGLMLNESVKYKRMMLAERELKDMYKEMSDKKTLNMKELVENKAAAILSLVTMALTAVVKQASDKERGKEQRKQVKSWVIGIFVAAITLLVVFIGLRLAGMI